MKKENLQRCEELIGTSGMELRAFLIGYSMKVFCKYFSNVEVLSNQMPAITTYFHQKSTATSFFGQVMYCYIPQKFHLLHFPCLKYSVRKLFCKFIVTHRL